MRPAIVGGFTGSFDWVRSDICAPSLRIVHHIQHDVRLGLAVIDPQRHLAIADLEDRGGERVFAVGVLGIGAQDRQVALAIVQCRQQIRPARGGRPACWWKC